MFVTFQAALDVALEVWPAIRDPEFGVKLARLGAQLADADDRPLVLLLGSSRSDVGINPRAFVSPTTDTTRPIVFNFAMTGAGPIQQLILLRELLARRIVPAKVLVELHPLFLNQRAGALREEARIDARRLGHPGLTVLCGYSQTPARLRRDWWCGKALPWHAYRHQLLEASLAGWCVRPGQHAVFRRVEAAGWLPLAVAERGDDARRERLDHARLEYQNALPDFGVTSEPDRALHELFDLCARRHIAVGVYLMPEASEFRSWYPPGARRTVDDYLGRLRDEYAFEVYDFSTSIGDESFADGHHLLPEAVAEFSARFAHEVIETPPTDASRQADTRRRLIEPSESRR